jgi:hypothetical protein
MMYSASRKFACAQAGSRDSVGTPGYVRCFSDCHVHPVGIERISRELRRKFTEPAIRAARKNIGAIDEYQKSWKIMINCLSIMYFSPIFVRVAVRA